MRDPNTVEGSGLVFGIVCSLTIWALMAVFFSGCGSDPTSVTGSTLVTPVSCTGMDILGRWAAVGSRSMNLNSDCTGTDSVCGPFTWAPGEPDHDLIKTMTVTVTNGAASCPSIGTHLCTVFLTTSYSSPGIVEQIMTISCGALAVDFSKRIAP